MYMYTHFISNQYETDKLNSICKIWRKKNNPCLYKVTIGDTFETQLKGGLEYFNPLVRD